MALAFGVSLAQGAKEVTSYFGSDGTLGGQFTLPGEVAVNQTGAGAGNVGDIYVVDDYNQRIQRFDSDRVFVSAWGADVLQPEGGSDFEVCTVAADCKAGLESGGNGTTAGNGTLDNPQSIAIDQDTGVVYVSDRDNRRVSAYDGDGAFLFTVGRDVQEPDGDTATEICGDAGGDVCLQGDEGTDPGNLGTTFTDGTLGIAVSSPDGNASTGTIFLADSANQRVNTYDLDGQNPASFGSAANFGSEQPREIAVDSRGIVYASDSDNGAEIDRYDSEDANGGGVGFLASIASPPLLEGDTTATGGLAVDPDSDGGGTGDEDILYVARTPWSGTTVVQQFGPTNEPGATTAPTASDDEHGGGAGFGPVRGFGADDSTGRLFVSTPYPTVGASGSHVYVLGDAPAPDATLDPVGDPDARSATIEGTVDANGAESGYHFEVSTDGGATWTNRPTGGNIAVGSSDDPEDVTYDLEGLNPSTEYQVRLIAKQTFGSASGVSNVVTFTTDSAGPVVSSVATADAGTTEVTLTGRIDPSGEATTYRFEYGLTDSYGSEVPVPDGDIAAGHGSVPVTAVVTGLASGTVYHYRLVATNATGTTTGEDHTFATGAPAVACPNEALRTGPSSRLPDCRAYEQVSPVDKNGGEAEWYGSVLGGSEGARSVSAAGDKVMFASDAEFAGAESGGGTLDSEYISRRENDGWVTKPLFPVIEPAASGRRVGPSSSDLSHTLLTTSGVMEIDTPQTPGAFNVYDRDNVSEVIDQWLGITTFNSGNQFRAQVATPDWSHVVFASAAMLTDDPDLPSEFVEKVYEMVGGELRLVSITPSGTPVEGRAYPGGESTFNSFPVSTVGAVSYDGRHIFFNDENLIYRRTDGDATALASPSRRSVDDPAGKKPKIYRIASTDGNRVFFTSQEHLTDDANTGPSRNGTDLYLYDFEDDELVDITATAGGDGAQVQGVLGADEAGSRVYYVAHGQVVPGEGSASGTEPNLYLWEDDGTPDGTTRFIATLSTADKANWFKLNGEWTARTSKDGGSIVFESEATIPGHDNGGVGVRQVYHYRAAGDGGDGTLSCVSCNPDGDTPIGPASIPHHALGGSVQRWEQPRGLSSDGRTVFFHTADALATGDGNGLTDAYMWRDGELSLLSTGQSSRESFMYNASASGDDAFIITGEALVGQDRDDRLDLYDARVGGGFPAPTPAPDCSGDACQGEGSSPPDEGDKPASGELNGSGNVGSGSRLTLAIKRLTKVQRARLARGRQIGVRVRVTGATRVNLAMRASIRGRRTTVAKGAVRTRRARTVAIGMRLNSKALRRLRRAGSLRLSLSATARGARSRHLTIRLTRAR